MKNLAIFMYRHVLSKHVIISKEYDIIKKPSLLKQIKNKAILPQLTRPDLWMPMAILHGFNSAQTHKNVYSMLTHHLPTPIEILERTKQLTLKDYTQMELKKKRAFESDMVNPKVDQLCRVLVYLSSLDKKADYNLRIYWGNEKLKHTGLMDSGLEWPSNIEHRKLDIVRSNIIMNPEIKHLYGLRKCHKQNEIIY
ncbi:hypothetical protein BB561_000625 [Smittium simulii]|uniref:Uncharacterized protein n=1 Tax=Smittium simulii TaxID=133385 RepID=A0A2T9YY95_9FUNG|nr:hypothetical protein BB561_000625 [Smittium simulii]